ncbi:MAG: RHS repeat domain-containing protein [Leadbetterella sp.]
MIRQSENQDQNEVLSISQYSPFGMELGGSHQNLSQQYAFKYNGKEVDAFSSYLDYGARWFSLSREVRNGNQNRGGWVSIDPLAEKYYSESLFSYALNNPIFFVDPDGRDVDISRLTGSNSLGALLNLLKTKQGFDMIAKFMKSGTTELKNSSGAKITFQNGSQDGERAKDKLVLVSNNPEIMDDNFGVNGTTVGLTREFQNEEGWKELGEDPNYDLNKGVKYLVDLDNSESIEESFTTLSHELFVHVDPKVQKVKKAEALIKAGILKPGTKEYIKYLKALTNTADEDHKRLGNGQVTKFREAAKNAAKKTGNTNYNSSYQKDVENH